MVFIFQITRTPISTRAAQMSQVQELFHEAAQQVGLDGVGVCEGTAKACEQRVTRREAEWKHHTVLFQKFTLVLQLDQENIIANS